MKKRAAYAKSWSQSAAERKESLAKIVADDVTYADPNTDRFGVDAFSSHMAQFQEDLRGAYCEMSGVKGHHNKTLVRWRLCSKDGGEIMQGASFATLNDDGKFTSFSGLFRANIYFQNGLGGIFRNSTGHGPKKT